MTVFIILCYDVNSKNDKQLRKIALQYLRPVQRSVYEGYITAGKLTKLKKDIQNVIQIESESVIIYELSTTAVVQKDQLGKVTSNNGRFV